MLHMIIKTSMIIASVLCTYCGPQNSSSVLCVEAQAQAGDWRCANCNTTNKRNITECTCGVKNLCNTNRQENILMQVVKKMGVSNLIDTDNVENIAKLRSIIALRDITETEGNNYRVSFLCGSETMIYMGYVENTLLVCTKCLPLTERKLLIVNTSINEQRLLYRNKEIFTRLIRCSEDHRLYLEFMMWMPDRRGNGSNIARSTGLNYLLDDIDQHMDHQR